MSNPIKLIPGLQEVPTSGIQAYVMVYSVADKDSFDEAILTLYELRKNEDSQKSAVILVANKTDMVRNPPNYQHNPPKWAIIEYSTYLH